MFIQSQPLQIEDTYISKMFFFKRTIYTQLLGKSFHQTCARSWLRFVGDAL